MVGSFKHRTPPSSTGWRVNLDTEQKAGPALYELRNADEPRKIDYGDIHCLGPFCKISVKSRGSLGACFGSHSRVSQVRAASERVVSLLRWIGSLSRTATSGRVRSAVPYAAPSWSSRAR